MSLAHTTGHVSMKVLVAVEDDQFLSEFSAFMAVHPWSATFEYFVLHVILPVKIGSFMSVLPSPLLENITKEKMVAGHALVEKAKETIESTHKDANVHVEVCEGLPKEEILDRAKSHGVSMIVMGTHRRSVSDLMVGNVTQAVVSNAPCSVLVIPLPNKGGQKSTNAKEPHKII